MSPCFDFPSLLCEEEEEYTVLFEERLGHHQDRRSIRPFSDVSGGDSINRFPVQSDECISLMVKKEYEQLTKSDYLSKLRTGDLDLVSRVEAINWISKVISYYNFGPLCAYLAVSYLDRFLSAYRPSKDQDWKMQLFAVACLSLAAKMEETEVPLILNLQVAESKFVFEAKTIQRMELMVLSTLKWRMQAITPFSFLDNFIYKINGEKNPSQYAITQSTNLILRIVTGIEYLEYRPSEIAAAVAMSVCEETNTVEVDKSIHLLYEDVQKDRVLECIDMIQALQERGLNGNFTPSVPRSPMGVLDIPCSSHTSDESPVGSCANSPYLSVGTKRRRLYL